MRSTINTITNYCDTAVSFGRAIIVAVNGNGSKHDSLRHSKQKQSKHALRATSAFDDVRDLFDVVAMQLSRAMRAVMRTERQGVGRWLSTSQQWCGLKRPTTCPVYALAVIPGSVAHS
jgi:hypothetical protein